METQRLILYYTAYSTRLIREFTLINGRANKTQHTQPSSHLGRARTSRTTLGAARSKTPIPNLHPHRSIPVGSPHAPLIAPKLLPLPDLDGGLALLQRLLARPPRRLPMRGRQRDQDALLADRDRPQSMDHGDGRQAVLRLHRPRHAQEAVERFRHVGAVPELLDRLAVEVVARRACLV